MKNNLVIRTETNADIVEISELTRAAFESLAVSSHTEQYIVDALRNLGALTISLVAELDGQLVGHLAFSPVVMSDGTPNWFGLGPVSVLPAFQRQGIGQALIEDGLARLKRNEAGGCCLVGHPAYYGRFGFQNVSELSLEGVPPEVFFALSFDGRIPQGTVQFHPAFFTTGPLP